MSNKFVAIENRQDVILRKNCLQEKKHLYVKHTNQ